MESQFNNNTNQIEIGRLIRYVLMQSKLVASFVFIIFLISTAYYINATKLYKISSLLQVESSNQNIFDPTNTMELGTMSQSGDISNLVTLYESRSNIIRLIKELKLNIEIENLIGSEYIDINIESISTDKETRAEFIFESDGKFIKIINSETNAFVNFGKNEEIEFQNFYIKINDFNVEKNKKIIINYSDPSNLYGKYKANINVTSSLQRNSWFRQEGLMVVSFTTDDIILGKKILNHANKIFLENRILAETEKARKAIAFIDTNITSLRGVVNTNKEKLKEFRERNKSINVELEIQAIIEKIQAIESALYEIEIELTNASELYTQTNPIFLNLLKKKEILKSQRSKILSEIRALPKEQQEYIDLFNSVEISQGLFEELENRRLGFSIVEASTIGNIRIVDDAYLESLVSPRLTLILFSTIIAFILACIFAIIRGFNFLPITNPAELFDNGISNPIAGVIPLVNNIDSISDDVAFSNSIESMIVNIQSIQGKQLEKNIIAITSPSPSNGKSLISIYLAEKLAEIGKKVILVDNDLKRGRLGKHYNIKSIKEHDFINIADNIEGFKLTKNLYFLPKVTKLHNTFQFVSGVNYHNTMNFLKETFDYIIFDTAPILSVADTPVLITKSDFNFLIVRHGINRINEIRQSIDSFKQIDRNLDGIIYNAYAKPKSYYGLYSIYGNYAYQYYAEKYLDDTYEYKK